MKLVICIPDPTYDQAGPENASEIFQKDIEKTYRQKFTPVDIGAGADWPAFQTIIELSPILAVPLGLFFLGEKIEKNFVKGLAQPGDMVGPIAGQAIGEPSTQMVSKSNQKDSYSQSN